MIHLEYNNLVNYLVSSGYFGFEQVVDNQIIIKKRQTKNNTFSVKIGIEKGIFVKQFIENIEYPFNALWREEFIRSKELQPQLNEKIKEAIIPFPTENKLNSIDEQRKILITKLISNTSDIQGKINQNDIFDNLIEIIKDLHNSEINNLWKYKKRLNYAPILLERIFYKKYSKDGNINLCFWSKFEKERKKIGNILNEFWYDSKSLIHNDLNINNILIQADNKIYITDWEYLSLGDPTWDFAKLDNNLKEEKINKKIDSQNFDENRFNFYKISIELWLNYLDLKRNKSDKLSKEISDNIENFKEALHKVKVSNTKEIHARR
jgi:thiamine kinase-like enzyme